MLEINRSPSRRELNWFGLALLTFFGVVGGIVLWRTGSLAVPRVLWLAGVMVAGCYYAIPPLRKPIFVGWSYLTYPLGWLLTHAILALIFYALLTPLGLLMRLFGRDPMHRRFDPDAESHWVERKPPAETARYFRQF